MRVKIRSIMAGPNISARPGDELDLPDAQARALVAGGFAAAVAPAPERAVAPAPESAIAPAPESASAPERSPDPVEPPAVIDAPAKPSVGRKRRR